MPINVPLQKTKLYNITKVKTTNTKAINSSNSFINVNFFELLFTTIKATDNKGIPEAKTVVSPDKEPVKLNGINTCTFAGIKPNPAIKV